MMKSGLIPRVPWLTPQDTGTFSTVFTILQDDVASLGNSQPPRLHFGCLSSFQISHGKYSVILLIALIGNNVPGFFIHDFLFINCVCINIEFFF